MNKPIVYVEMKASQPLAPSESAVASDGTEYSADNHVYRIEERHVDEFLARGFRTIRYENERVAQSEADAVAANAAAHPPVPAEEETRDVFAKVKKPRRTPTKKAAAKKAKRK